MCDPQNHNGQNSEEDEEPEQVGGHQTGNHASEDHNIPDPEHDQRHIGIVGLLPVFSDVVQPA